MPDNQCVLPSWYNKTLFGFQFGTYFILSPITFIFGIGIHIVFLIAFYQQSKKERPYNYQIFLVATETFEILTLFLYSLSNHWCSDPYSTETWWCSRNYAIVWYGFHVSFQLCNGITTMKLLLSVCTSLDRYLAMAKPVLYKNMRHGLRQSVAFAISLLLGLGTSAFDCFRYGVQETSDGHFEWVINDSFVHSIAGEALSVLRSVVRFVGLLLLLGFNIMILKVYKQTRAKVASMTQASDAKETRRRSNERTLTLLTISQSTLTSIDIAFYICFHAMRYFAPEFGTCAGQLIEPVLDTTLELTSSVNLYIMLRVSEPVRRMVAKAICCRCSFGNGGNGVTGRTITPGPA